ncbi:muscarinic acetylcholine receptor M3 [Eucyclogobius newberryi]|uniref:muscarinic acetylcholine receptor M3 n=1 Tax=Eucyclogobius newberryi TaxID=166745 RepID=UPI003B5AA784
MTSSLSLVPQANPSPPGENPPLEPHPLDVLAAVREWSGSDQRENMSHLNYTPASAPREFDPLGGHTVWQVILIVFLTGSLSLVTVVGNILVLVSFKINKALKTVNNYYLLSLAFADLTIGTLSMNLYTTYIIMDQWALGPLVCDVWLAIDYVASNASVMNLLVISFDRYFSVTRPLTYMAKRTTKRAMVMICLAWSVSLVLWAPAILFWQYIVGERTVQPTECYIQFLSEPIITFCTAIAAFYLPVSIMSVLFWRIYQETEKRAKDVQGLKGSGSAPRPSHTDGGALRQMSSKSCSSVELNQTQEVSKQGQTGPSYSLRAFCCPFPSNMSPRAVGVIGQGSTDSVNRVSIRRDTSQPPATPTGKTRSQEKQHSPVVQMPPISIRDATVAKRFAATAKSEINKRRNEKKTNERKAARTLSAILLAFVTTWLPYNIMVLVNTFCQNCIPDSLWALGYWLCYVNSTINPMCYALCNKTFRDTFRDILLCQWSQRKKARAAFRR